MAVESSTVASKLPHEDDHLNALNRMRTLESYYAWSIGLLRTWIGKRIMDAGCGVGNGTEMFASNAEYVLAVDLSSQNIAQIEERFRDRSHVKPMQIDLDDDLGHLQPMKLDTIVCLDVLEHVEDDVGLLKRLRAIIQPEGHLLLKVPACQWLFGSIDEASGHYRRYSRKILRDRAEQAGWQFVHSSYMNIFGVVPYFIKSRLLKRQANLSRTFPHWQLRLIRLAIPLLSRIDRTIGPPIGQSVILVVKNPSVIQQASESDQIDDG